MLLTEQQEDNQILNIQISDLSAFTNMLFRSAEQKHGHTDLASLKLQYSKSKQ